jgi:hypothetical protein
MRDCPLAVNESHVSHIHSAAGRGALQRIVADVLLSPTLAACRLIFSATTEVLFVTFAAVCDHHYRNRSFVTRWIKEKLR